MQQNPSLTGLRGFAAAIVVASHLANEGYLPHVFAGAGKLGVQMFFVLSAYLMTRLYFHRRPEDAFGHYARARAGRVLPLYYLVVLVSLFFAGDPAWRYQFDGMLLPALTLADAPAELWAIPVEVQFYVCFALFWIMWHRGLFAERGRLYAFLAVLLVACLVATVALQFLHRDISRLNIYLPVFALGVFAAMNEQRLLAWIEPRRWLQVVAVVLLAMSLPGVRELFGLHIPVVGDPFAIATAFVFFVMTLGGRGFFRIMSARALVKLGEISYGYYVLHHLVITWVEVRYPQMPGWLAVPLILLVSYALAEASFRLFESPARKMVRLLGLPKSRSSA